MKTHTITNIDKDWYYDLESKIEEWVRTVYIDSWGWEVARSYVMRWLMEKNNVELIFVYFCASSAFDMFYKYKWNKKLIQWCHAMCHRTQITTIVKDNWTNPNEWSDAQVESMKQSQRKPYSFMTKKEKKEFDKWRDVYFDFERLKEIFKWIEIVE